MGEGTGGTGERTEQGGESCSALIILTSQGWKSLAILTGKNMILLTLNIFLSNHCNQHAVIRIDLKAMHFSAESLTIRKQGAGT